MPFITLKKSGESWAYKTFA